jgi:hypothetical protein
MEEVRVTHMLEEDGYLIDTANKIILKKLGSMPAPTGCPNTAIFTTEYHNLFLANPDNSWPPMSSDADITDFIRARDNYIMHQLEKKMLHNYASFHQKICEQNLMSTRSNAIHHLQGSHFFKPNGHTIEYMDCPLHQATIVENSQHCYHDIPILGPTGPGFVRPSNQVHMSHSAPRPCVTHFGLKVFTNEGIWIELSPTLHEIEAPPQMTLTPSTQEHTYEDLSEGGIYSVTELDNWRKHLEIGDYHDAISQTITFGVCVHEGQCPIQSAAPVFNLQQLRPTTWITTNPLTKLRHFINTNAVYISLLVLIIETSKFLIFITLFAQTLIRDGLAGAQALLHILCCNMLRQSQKIARRKQRHYNVNAEEEDIMELNQIDSSPDVEAGCSVSPHIAPKAILYSKM